MKTIPLIVFFLIYCSSLCEASGAVQKRKAQQQQIIQQKVVMQRVMEEQKKAIAQRAVQSQQGAINQALKEHYTKIARQVLAVKMAVQKKIIGHKVGTAQKVSAQTEAISRQVMGQQKAIMDRIAQQERQKLYAIQRVPTDDEPVTEADAIDVLLALEKNGAVWYQIIDPESKVFIINQFIKANQEQGIVMRKSAGEYVEMVDAMSVQSPEIFSYPFNDLLTILAVMEYDYDNGHNADEVARAFLGEEVYRENVNRMASQSK
ncbi:MAG: hypothetical protein ABIJ41_05545 [Candidatus Omnitrophota bacterium]